MSKAQGHKYFWKQSKPLHVGIYQKAPCEYFQMRTHVPGFYFAPFLIDKISHQKYDD